MALYRTGRSQTAEIPTLRSPKRRKCTGSQYGVWLAWCGRLAIVRMGGNLQVKIVRLLPKWDGYGIDAPREVTLRTIVIDSVILAVVIEDQRWGKWVCKRCRRWACLGRARRLGPSSTSIRVATTVRVALCKYRCQKAAPGCRKVGPQTGCEVRRGRLRMGEQNRTGRRGSNLQTNSHRFGTPLRRTITAWAVTSGD